MTIIIQIVLHNKDYKIVEVLYDVEKLSIEWIILELAFEYQYLNTIKEIEILKYWDGELQSRIIAESNGLRNESARSDNRVLLEYHNFKNLNSKSFPK